MNNPPTILPGGPPPRLIAEGYEQQQTSNAQNSFSCRNNFAVFPGPGESDAEDGSSGCSLAILGDSPPRGVGESDKNFKGTWSRQELFLLIEGLLEHGRKWKLIALKIESRQPSQVRQKGVSLLQKIVTEYSLEGYGSATSRSSPRLHPHLIKILRDIYTSLSSSSDYCQAMPEEDTFWSPFYQDMGYPLVGMDHDCPIEERSTSCSVSDHSFALPNQNRDVVTPILPPRALENAGGVQLEPIYYMNGYHPSQPPANSFVLPTYNEEVARGKRQRADCADGEVPKKRHVGEPPARNLQQINRTEQFGQMAPVLQALANSCIAKNIL